MPSSFRVVTAALRIAVIAVTMLTADPAIAADSLKDLDWITGTWRGTTNGEPGEGMIERACRYVLAGRFIECHTTAMYPPQEKNKNGEVHTEVGWFSFDKRAKKIRLRQFHVEGFVNTYIESEPLVFVTEAIENIPPGWRAREAWQRPAGDELVEIFSMAAPEKDLEVYSQGIMKKVK